MATFTDQDKRRMLSVIADMPATFTHQVAGSATVATHTNGGTIGALVATKDLEVGGLMDEPDLTLTTTIQKLDTDGTSLTNRFTTVPAPGDKIAVSGTTYRVAQKTTDEISSALVLDLISAHR